ncbi:MAG: class I adenylate-forming enzyme family protein [Candidatus Sericytochromatia bacterium]
MRDADGFISYRELSQAVQTQVLALQARFGPGKRFLLPAEHSRAFVRDWLALMVAGMLVIPTHPTLPEIAQKQLQKQFRALCFSPELAAKLTAGNAQHLSGKGSDSQHISAPDTPCLALLTSGSSGEVKAASFLPAALFWNAMAVRQFQALEQPGKMAIHLPLNHAFGLITQLLPALLAASPVWLLPHQLWPGDLLTFLRTDQIETFAAVPSTLRLMLQGPSAPLPHLRHLSVAGAALHPEEIPGLQAVFPAARIWIGYGLTEAGPRVSAFANEDPEFGSGSAGRPLPGIAIKIEGDEIWVQSPSLMVGYLEAPELTAETFYDGWLKTGDSGYLSESGLLFITGRRDDTLLSGGEKVAPLAVERALQSHSAILHAAIYGEADPVLGSHLVALIELQPEAEQPTLYALRQFCKQNLEPQQIPRQFFRVEFLPLTPNGKLLRKELPTWPKHPWS